MKNKLFLFIVFISNLLLSQNPKNFISVDSNGQIREVNPTNCSSTPIASCSNVKAFSIAFLNNEIYFIDGTNFPGMGQQLFKTGFNSSSSCIPLGSFQGNLVTALTSSQDGFIYAASDNRIEKFDPVTNTFSVVGNLPSQWESSGDLIFHKGKLLMATKSFKLIEIDLANLNNSKEILDFPSGSQIFGLSTVNTSCGENQLFAINVSGLSTSLLPINLDTKTVGTTTCTLNFTIFDTASSAENGSTSMITPTFNPVSTICEGTTLTALPTSSTNGITGSWSPALDNTKTTTYTFTPSTGQCAATASLTVTVNPKVTPNFNPVSAICEGTTLADLPTKSTNGITGTWSPALDNTKTTTYTFTPSTGKCATTASLTVTVNPQATPNFNPVSTICEGGTLTALPTTSTNGITGTWSPALDNTKTTTYTFTPSTGQCSATASLTVSVNPKVTPNFNPVSSICESATLAALPTKSTNGITGTWSPALDNTKTTTYTFTPSTGECASSTSLTVTVNSLPRPNPIDGVICFNSVTNTNSSYTIESNLDKLSHTFEWFKDGIVLNETSESLTVDTPGNYSIIAKDINTGCFSTSKLILVTLINTPITIRYTFSEAFQDTQSIKIIASGGLGELNYQLDNESIQTSPIFENVSPGEHLITVDDTKGCTTEKLKVILINYPHYFTPNGDSYHEYWNIIGLSNQPNSKIFIFDRFGKLIKEMSGASLGWDGTFNGQPLPSSDYWFHVIFRENDIEKEFRSHFSLKR
ncbi:T9SS type B sorting domain-containing protein [Flavobacterium sp.]|uniref:T9SS type B sorting domain-containing protein n=1 Tax=Flavobacterium sp. TaxID=239 RepID=UPI00286F50BA|nr:T9SS type B sorting domain-containing protein [Flavobacterium sp.]